MGHAVEDGDAGRLAGRVAAPAPSYRQLHEMQNELGSMIRPCDHCDGHGVEVDITIHDLDPCPRCVDMPRIAWTELSDPVERRRAKGRGWFTPDPNTVMKWCFDHSKVVGDGSEHADCSVDWVARPSRLETVSDPDDYASEWFHGHHFPS